MGRFAPVYTPDQRAAFTRAAVDDQIPPTRVAEIAAAGELYGLEPFTVPVSTIKDYAKKERRRREKAAPKLKDLGNGTAAADALRRRVLVLADAMLDQADKRRIQRKLTPADFETTSRAVLRIAAQLEGKMSDPAKPDQHGAQLRGQEGERSLFERLSGNGSSKPARDTAQ